jgi:hypothetical protein
VRVAQLAPRPDVPCTVRRVSGASMAMSATTVPAMASAGQTVGSHTAMGPEHPGTSTPLNPPAAAEVPSRPAVVTPLSPDRYKLQLTISGEALEMLRLAKDMLGHAVPSGDDAIVLERALRALLAELARKKFADTGSARSPMDSAPGETAAVRERCRTVPAAVERVVWVRDLGRCAFVARSGHRCNERRFVEFHHVDPYALGGEATVDGIQLRCRRHNEYEGRLYFGNRREAELVPEQVQLSPARSTQKDAEEVELRNPT